MDTVRARGIEEWSALCSRSFVPLRADGDGSFSGLVRHLSVDDIGVSYVESTSSRVYRTPRLIQREPRDDVLLSIQASGTGRISQAGRLATLLPGAGALYDADRAYELLFPGAMSEVVLQIPRSRLGVRDSLLRDVTARSLAPGSTLTVLRHFLTGLLATGDAPTSELEPLAEIAAELLSSALRPLLGTSGRVLSGDALWHAVRADLERRFTDPMLTVDALARDHRVSRRYLETVFSAHQTSPATHLRNLRLGRARELLLGSSMTITSVAYAAGFSEVNTFIRAFRRAHGQTPESWRRERRPTAGTPDATSQP